VISYPDLCWYAAQMMPFRMLGRSVCFFVALPLCAAASDASFYGVVKVAQFQQTLSSPPTPLASNAYTLTAFVTASTNYAVTNATFKAPNASTNRPLTLATNGGSLEYVEQFQTQSALDTTYPSSTSLFSPSVYSLTMYGVHDGVKTGNASYLLGGTPPIPQISNLTNGQSIDTTTSLTLRWTAMGGLAGIVQLLVLDQASNVVFSSPAPFSPGALDQTSTSGTIPPNSLLAGTNLIGHLIFGQPGLPDTNSYVGAVGIAAIARDTAFPLLTRPAPVPPRLQIGPPNAAPWVVHFIGETNRNYHLQANTNLVGGSWIDLLVTNSPAATFTDTQSVSLPQRFYRVQVGP
jgi:hypothetical protein